MSKLRSQIISPLYRDLPAGKVRAHFSNGAVPLVRLAGPPGAGKTALLEATVRRMYGRWRVAVIVCNPAADRDAQTLRKWCAHVGAINGTTADPRTFRRAVERIDPTRVDLVFLEGCGGITPFPDVGEDAIVAVLGVSCGDDKAAEYANLVSRSSAVVLTKTDLLPYIRFNDDVFREDVRRSNPAAPVMELSVIDGRGVDAWTAWLEERLAAARPARRSAACGSEMFVG